MSARHKARRERLLKAGLCGSCGKAPRDGEKKECTRCLEINIAKSSKSRAAARRKNFAPSQTVWDALGDRINFDRIAV